MSSCSMTRSRLSARRLWQFPIRKIHLALDYFDASMNRVGAWVLGARAVEQGLLQALPPSREKLEEAELQGDNLSKLYWRQYVRDLPLAAVWDYYCLMMDVPLESEWLGKIKEYEKNVLSRRN